MDYQGNENIDSNGYVVDRSKEVYQNYDKVESDRISPNGYVWPEGGADDEEQDRFTGRAASFPLSFKFAIGVIIAVVLLDKVFAALIPFMKSVLVPSLLMMLFLTFLLPNVKNVLLSNKEGRKSVQQRKKYRVIWCVNMLISFLITYPLVSPTSYEWTASIGDNFMDKDSVLMSFLGLVIVVLLYIIRFVVPMIIIPAI